MVKRTFLIISLAGLLLAQSVDVAPRILAVRTFAELGTPSNGTILYCSTCTAANPCAGSGSGAMARRENGAWNCTGSSGGSGDVTSTASSSVDGEMALYNSTTGKSIKRSALTGVLKAASGVASVVTGTSTNCVLVDGTSAACGSGAGDVTSNTATSVDGEMALFNSTTGKQIKRATLTGVLKSASGVPAVVTGTSTNCVLVDGTSTACASSYRTVLHHAYNTDVVGDNSAGQVWATYTIPGGTLVAGDIVEVRCQLRKTAGTANDRNIGMYFGNGVTPAYGLSVVTDNQYTYYVDWLVASSTVAMPMGFKGSPVSVLNVGTQAGGAVDASSLNLAGDIIVKMQTTSGGQIDNTNTIKVVAFTVTRYRPS